MNAVQQAQQLANELQGARLFVSAETGNYLIVAANAAINNSHLHAGIERYTNDMYMEFNLADYVATYRNHFNNMVVTVAEFVAEMQRIVNAKVVHTI